jgi:hypothetical protein
MQVAARSYLTAGVTLVAASAIALSPIAPPLPAVHLPSVHQAEVELAAATGGVLGTWVQVVNKAINNTALLGTYAAAHPFPILAQVAADQSANLAVLSNAAQTTFSAVAALGQSLATNIPIALRQIAAGDLTGAEATLLNSKTVSLLLALTTGPLAAWTVVTNTAQNFTNLLGNVAAIVNNEGTPILGVVYSVANALTDSGQTAVDDATAGDLAGVINALANAPAEVAGAFLNGFGTGPLGLPGVGLLTPYDASLQSFGSGPIGMALNLLQKIAATLKPLSIPKVTAAAQKTIEAPAAAALPTAGTLVTLSTATPLKRTLAATPKKITTAATPSVDAAAPGTVAAGGTSTQDNKSSSNGSASSPAKSTSGDHRANAGKAAGPKHAAANSKG